MWARGGHKKGARGTIACLTQFSPTFGPGMGRSSPAFQFRSGRWVAFPHFFVCADAFGHVMSIWVGPLEIPLWCLRFLHLWSAGCLAARHRSDQENSLFLHAVISVVSRNNIVPTLHLEQSMPTFVVDAAPAAACARCRCSVNGCLGCESASAYKEGETSTSHIYVSGMQKSNVAQ
jgi:hypothetical protein